MELSLAWELLRFGIKDMLEYLLIRRNGRANSDSSNTTEVALSGYCLLRAIKEAAGRLALRSPPWMAMGKNRQERLSYASWGWARTGGNSCPTKTRGGKPADEV